MSTVFSRRRERHSSHAARVRTRRVKTKKQKNILQIHLADFHTCEETRNKVMILRGKITEQTGFQWCRKTSAKVVTKILGDGERGMLVIYPSRVNCRF